MLEALVATPTTRALSPVLVTGTTVAGERAARCCALVGQVAGTAPSWPRRLDVVPLEGTSRSVVGPWDQPALGAAW